MTQDNLRKTLTMFLNKYYKRVISTKHYICAIGEIPIALAAHMDTVFEVPSEIFYDDKRNVMWSPTGMGADDRTGIFMIIQIIKSGLRPHIIFSTDEEKGCVGASILAGQKCPFKDLRYIIQLDRRGTNDCVFYDCDNRPFVEYVESFGFSEAIGSFTDISTICPKWEVAGVNLSVGYKEEHTDTERLYVTPMFATMDKVKRMLTDPNMPEKFEYIPSKWYGAYGYGSWLNGGLEGLYGYHGYIDEQCDNCHKIFLPEEMLGYQSKNGFYRNVCTDCFIKVNTAYCDKCKDCFELPEGTIVKSGDKVICPTCKKINERTEKNKNGNSNK
jgi:hypothetical protein